MNDAVAMLAALSDRWRPTRAGLIALWRYWDETFAFHRGRLLLRGPNGSGKSMALELLLPFVIDADANPSRLTSAAKSRGGLYDRVMTGSDDASRTGFAWVEFARGDDTFTAGARMRASQATRKVDVDFFTTTLAVGRELHLLDTTRTPLSRRALVEAIGDTGRVHSSAEEHRAAVREVLFPGFSADRYASVIGALLALRREKLSQNLDLAKLSEVLSEALPPLDDHDIAVVAEGFERLDRRKAELAVLEAELAEVRQLAGRQRDYARAVMVGVAGEVRTAESQRDGVTRAERQAKVALEEVEGEAAAAATERTDLEDRIAAITVEIDALKDSDAYRQGAALADLRAHAHRLRQIADRAKSFAAEQNATRDAAALEFDAAAGLQDTAATNLELAERDVVVAAKHIGAEGVVAEADAIDDPDDAERLMHAWVEAHRTRLLEVRAALADYDCALGARTHVEGQVADDEATVAARIASRDAARDAEDAAVIAYRDAVEHWATTCEAIGAPQVSGVLPRPIDDPAAIADAVAGLRAALGAADAVARRDLEAQREAVEDERVALLDERARWAEGGPVDPEGPSWRSSRAGRPGAALWRLVDVRPDVDPADVDGLETALTGAGLIDAWVQPDGSVDLGDDRADIVVTLRPATSRTLAHLLVPADAAPEASVAPSVVAGVLASVPLTASGHDLSSGLDSDDVAVATDGTYRLGAAVGRGPQRPAVLLGSVARERHRLARLADLDNELTAVDARHADLDRAEAGLDRRQAAVSAELDAVPSGAAVVDARRSLADAMARLDEADSRLAAARRALTEAESAVREALRALTTRAARHGLPTDNDGLAAVEAGVTRIERTTNTWVRRRRDMVVATREHDRAAARSADAKQASTRAAGDHADAERETIEVERRAAALDSTVGAEYSDLLVRIGALDGERTAKRRRDRDLADEMPVLQRRVGMFASELAAAESARVRAEEERARAQERFLAVLALADDAGVDVPDTLDTASAVLAAARATAAAHEGVDVRPQTIERLSERVRERVHAAQAALGGRVDLTRELSDTGWWVLRTVAGGVRRGASELATRLARELTEGRAELAADEENLFEQTLAGSVRRALAERIRLANALVDAINTQLETVRTAAGGVHVRLRWEVDGDQLDAVKAARSLLLRDPADLTDGERASLQAFVRARVNQARAEMEANAPWEARLRETLDYRAWHRFTLLLAHRDWEGFQPATARRLQKLSTGERSIALHLPMIASVAAHYTDEDGRPSTCPRLILLDELFAGVDTANRAQLFGTFSAWDLDAVFTTDHEWCQYAALDGIAIHHLHPPAGDEPVTSTRFTWDGHRRTIEPPAA